MSATGRKRTLPAPPRTDPVDRQLRGSRSASAYDLLQTVGHWMRIQAMKVTSGAIWLASALVALTYASTTSACTPTLPARLPGETTHEAVERATATSQARLWEAAHVVYLGQVIGMRLEGGSRYVVIRPTLRLKGTAPPRRITAADDSFCARRLGWTTGDTAVVFASRLGWRDSLVRAGQWMVLEAAPPDGITAPDVVAAIAATRK